MTMTCYICARAVTDRDTILHHPLGYLGETRRICGDCTDRLIHAWSRMLGETRRDALLDALPDHLSRVDSALHRAMRPRGTE